MYFLFESSTVLLCDSNEINTFFTDSINNENINSNNVKGNNNGNTDFTGFDSNGLLFKIKLGFIDTFTVKNLGNIILIMTLKTLLSLK